MAEQIRQPQRDVLASAFSDLTGGGPYLRSDGSAQPAKPNEINILAGHAGGDGGIRTLDRPLQAYNGLANRRLQPLGHVSYMRGMPDPAASRKRQN